MSPGGVWINRHEPCLRGKLKKKGRPAEQLAKKIGKLRCGMARLIAWERTNLQVIIEHVEMFAEGVQAGLRDDRRLWNSRQSAISRYLWIA